MALPISHHPAGMAAKPIRNEPLQLKRSNMVRSWQHDRIRTSPRRRRNPAVGCANPSAAPSGQVRDGPRPRGESGSLGLITASVWPGEDRLRIRVQMVTGRDDRAVPAASGCHEEGAAGSDARHPPSGESRWTGRRPLHRQGKDDARSRQGRRAPVAGGHRNTELGKPEGALAGQARLSSHPMSPRSTIASVIASAVVPANNDAATSH